MMFLLAGQVYSGILVYVGVEVEEVRTVVRLRDSVVGAGAMWHSFDAKCVRSSLKYKFNSHCPVMLTPGNGSFADLNAILKPRVSVREAQHSYVAQYVIRISASGNLQV
jgi:hypothetical protein